MIGSASSRPPFPVTLDNWQQAEQVGWTFQHMAEIFPSAAISRGSEAPHRLPTRPEPLDGVATTTYDGKPSTVGEVMAATDTDGWLVVRDGMVLSENYTGEMGPASPHLLMSVSKSIVGTVVASLVSQGLVDTTLPLSYYIPELAGCGYGEATARNALDMRSGIRFSEDYLDLDAEVRVLEQSFGWAPRRGPDVPVGMRAFLASLQQERLHGWPFSYRSCETDVLGWLCEAVTGRRFPEVASELVWGRIGAEFDASIGVDGEGTGMFDGGISATLGDLARFGLTLLNGGWSPTGAYVLPEWWIEDAFTGGPDSREAFAASPDDNRMPGGWYRSQFWFPYADGSVLACLGIHGQMIYVNRAARLVGVKLSAWPTPQDAWKLFTTIRAFDALAAQLG